MFICCRWKNEKKKLDFQYRRSGSAALDMAYVAAGRYDGYFQNDLIFGI